MILSNNLHQTMNAPQKEKQTTGLQTSESLENLNPKSRLSNDEISLRQTFMQTQKIIPLSNQIVNSPANQHTHYNPNIPQSYQLPSYNPLYQPVLMPSHSSYHNILKSTSHSMHDHSFEESATGIVNGNIQLPRISNVIINVQRKTKGDYIKLSTYNRNINELENNTAIAQTQYSEALSNNSGG